MYEERAKSLRWLSFNFPHIDNPQDDSDKMCNCINLYCTQAADAIEELSKPKWISVEDALPEEDVEVLISYRYKEGEGDTSHVDIDITTYGQMYFGGREVAGVKHWRPPFEYFSSNYEVIAWMPLPEPTKEEDNASNP